MMTVFFVLLALYFMIRGARESGFWGGNKVIEGALMFLAGLFLLFAQLPL
jgi:hypothetical protein